MLPPGATAGLMFSTVPAPPALRREPPGASQHRTLIEPEDLLRLTAQPQDGEAPLLVDIRPRRAYRRRHIPCSHNIPHGLLISGEPPERDLILVGERDGDSAAAIEALHAEGFNRRILHLRGGFPTWLDHDLPVNEGAVIPRLPALEPIPWFAGVIQQIGGRPAGLQR